MRELGITSLLKIVRFYKWAFGDLTEADSDLGVIGEFLVGETLDCLSDKRAAQAPFDLTTTDGVSVEVKSTSATTPRASGARVYCWRLNDQRTALEGKRPLADIWVFLAAKFPKQSSSRRAKQLSVFDPQHWSCWLATGETVRDSGCRTKISETTLENLGVHPIPFSDFKPAFRKLAKERKTIYGSQER